MTEAKRQAILDDIHAHFLKTAKPVLDWKKDYDRDNGNAVKEDRFYLVDHNYMAIEGSFPAREDWALGLVPVLNKHGYGADFKETSYCFYLMESDGFEPLAWESNREVYLRIKHIETGLTEKMCIGWIDFDSKYFTDCGGTVRSYLSTERMRLVIENGSDDYNEDDEDEDE